MTQINDTLFNADGKPVGGQATVTIKSPRFTTPDGRSIAENSLTVKVMNGAFSLQLEPTPPGVTYEVHFSISSTGSNWRETWEVPESDKPLKFAEVQPKKKKTSA